jgi:hypothetical protein
MSSEQNCVDRLIADVRQIDTEYLKKGDYHGAYEQFQFALLNRNYHGLDQRIRDNLHCGPSFTASVDRLSVCLEEGNSRQVDFFINLILGFGAQTHLPDGSAK